jgi:hypothetical protein
MADVLSVHNYDKLLCCCALQVLGPRYRYRNTLQLGPHPARSIFAMDKISGAIAFMGRFSNDSNILVS